MPLVRLAYKEGACPRAHSFLLFLALWDGSRRVVSHPWSIPRGKELKEASDQQPVGNGGCDSNDPRETELYQQPPAWAMVTEERAEAWRRCAHLPTLYRRLPRATIVPTAGCPLLTGT